VSAGSAAPGPVSIRLARPADVPALPPIERAAARLFEGLEENVADGETFSETHLEAARRRGCLWVATTPGDAPVAFALVEPMDGVLHLEEIDVHPDHARRGIGRRLIERVVARAREAGLAAVTLSTFRNVPWNAPYYERLGFRELSEPGWTPGIRARAAREVRQGLDTARRVVMRLDLERAPR